MATETQEFFHIIMSIWF